MSETVHLSAMQKVMIYDALWGNSLVIEKRITDDNGDNLYVRMKLPKYLNGDIVRNLPEVRKFINKWMRINDMPLMKIIHKYRSLIHKYGYVMLVDNYPEIYGDILLKLITKVAGLPYEIPYYHEQVLQIDDRNRQKS